MADWDLHHLDKAGRCLPLRVAEYMNDDILYHKLISSIPHQTLRELLEIRETFSYSTTLHVLLHHCYPTKATIDLIAHCGADFNAKNKDGESILCVAIMGNLCDKNTLSTLVAHGAKSRGINKKGETVVHVAARFGNTGALRYFLESGSSPNDTDNKGRTPLHVATTREDKSQTHRYSQTYELLVQSQGDIRALTKMEESVLHTAAKFGHVEAAQYFISLRVPVNATDGRGNTPIFYAVRNNEKKRSSEMVTLLLEHGADTNKVNNLGQTLLHVCARKGEHSVLKLLVEKGLDTNARDQDGNTPLHYALTGFRSPWNPVISTLELLISHGAKVDAKNDAGETPLLFGVSNVNNLRSEAVAVLLRDAEKEMKTQVLTVMLQCGPRLRSGVTKTCIDLGVHLAFTDDQERSLLHIAASSGCKSGVTELLQDKNIVKLVNARNNQGKTPLNLALMTDLEIQHGVVGPLLEAGAELELVKSDIVAKLQTCSISVRTLLEVVGVAKFEITKDLSRHALRVAVTSCQDLKSEELEEKWGKMIKKLISSGDVDINSKDEEGLTLLHVAVGSGCVLGVASLLDGGAEVNIEDNLGNTPLHHALLWTPPKNQLEVVTELIEFGGNVHSLNKKMYTPLVAALMRDSVLEVKTLEIFVEMRCAYAEEIATMALKQVVGGRVKHFERVTEFPTKLAETLVQNADLEWCDEEDNSLLHVAAKNGCVGGVKFLLGLGVIDVNAENCEGKTALHLVPCFVPPAGEFGRLTVRHGRRHESQEMTDRCDTLIKLLVEKANWRKVVDDDAQMVEEEVESDSDSDCNSWTG